ncbi:uncharacterized protein EI97DRAFT_461830 [Westerdykella ornata]|uniref:Extracellular membrane protein CFEM domain-containing protein n=1 Tax=Westerdykella ornata TaxID=318751 RepID=A0A6A6J8T7_WESOR|nr:uncharacterized protein EI97DRAFT_461830 [Westerdykella ornata]KAF2272573.1 hypothetical protein EI97DRAFT_461830 [Westerdykella ornata]
MKFIFALSALLTLSVASPLANPNADAEPQKGIDPVCSCRPPICPLELIAECRCKNKAAEACYEKWLAEGVQCPKPTPQVCGPVSRHT